MIREVEKEYKYDYSKKTKEERSKFVEDRLGSILNMPSYAIMGYSDSGRSDNRKFNRVPDMIDKYTTYILESSDAGSSRKTEYSYYISRRDEIRRETNRVLYLQSDGFDVQVNSSGGESLSHCETYIDEDKSYLGFKDFSFEDGETQMLKYAINKGLDIDGHKKVLSISAKILFESRDEELKSMVEQIVFNCSVNCNDDMDMLILKEYVKEASLREVSSKVGCSKNTVDRRLNKMLEWV